jgi:hypothetical protein
MVRKIKLEQFLEELKTQNVSRENLAFRCPACGTIQSARDLIKAGAGKNFDEIEKYLGFSCVGRWLGKGPPEKKDGKSDGCNWTLGGLFQIHELEVLDGEVCRKIFEPCTPAEAQAHAK